MMKIKIVPKIVQPIRYRIQYFVNNSKMYAGISKARRNWPLRNRRVASLNRAIVKAVGKHRIDDVHTRRIAMGIALKLAKHKWIRKVEIHEV